MEETLPAFVFYWLVVGAYVGAGICAGVGIGWLVRKPLWGAVAGAAIAAFIAGISARLGHTLMPLGWK
jgi:hypothetical protein